MNTTPTGTFGSEAGLPRVPLPSAEDTCERFLDWCAPLLTPAELEDTRRAVTNFRVDPVTGQVHDALAAYAAADGTHSWLDDFWDDRYLGRRDRIALNANFFFLFNDAPSGTAGSDDQTGRAVRLITAALAHKHGLDDESIPPSARRGQPLSMQQHRGLFSTTRIPGITRDGVRAPYGLSIAPDPASGTPVPAGPDGPSGATHILVFAGANAYAVDVITPDGEPHTPDEIAAALREAADAAASQGRGQGVGALTSKSRADWARSRAALLSVDGNDVPLETVETALFCVALESGPAGTAEEKCKRLLAGDPGSRWFDKAITFIVFGDGSAGINGEHCLLDGTTIVEFVDAVLTAPEPETGQAARGAARVAPVEFTLTPELSADIESAAKCFTAYDEDTATRTVSFEDFGSERAKSLKISPDAFVQLAFQVAHRRSKGFTGATYESIATRHFHHGRTEAMRVVTPEIVTLVESLDDPDATRSECRDALRAAASAHVARAKECQAGDAPEQHLWELQLVAKRQGIDWDPELYYSPGWGKMRDDYLSTSAAPSVNIQYFGFGATSEHCIGVAYLLLPQRFNVHLSTPRSVSGEMTAFAGRLGEAIAELSDLLEDTEVE
ncbi:MAG: choline/carnitine O-acyltransferase [Streptosporangiales bacterium]|nr:choline/carnitine O-acyltransferase [Streptosporangiales bacterium]